jgi:hypothetical protein
MQEEIWKDVVGYEGLYLISSKGNVKSKDREIFNGQGHFIRKGKKLKIMNDRYGYDYVNLYRECKMKSRKVHRLVAESFIENPLKKPQVNHLDGCKQNNSVLNLCWATSKENISHAFKNGLIKPISGEKHHYAKLSKMDVLDIKDELSKGCYPKIIAEKHKVHYRTITDIKLGYTWKHII